MARFRRSLCFVVILHARPRRDNIRHVGALATSCCRTLRILNPTTCNVTRARRRRSGTTPCWREKGSVVPLAERPVHSRLHVQRQKRLDQAVRPCVRQPTSVGATPPRADQYRCHVVRGNCVRLRDGVTCVRPPTPTNSIRLCTTYAAAGTAGRRARGLVTWLRCERSAPLQTHPSSRSQTTPLCRVLNQPLLSLADRAARSIATDVVLARRARAGRGPAAAAPGLRSTLQVVGFRSYSMRSAQGANVSDVVPPAAHAK